MQRKTKVLNDTDLSRRIDSVSKSVAESEIRIDVSTGWSKGRRVAVTLEIPVGKRSRRRLDHLVKSDPATGVERCAE